MNTVTVCNLMLDRSEAKFIVPEWGIASLFGGPVRQPYAAVIFIPPVRDYEFGYRPLKVWAILSVMFNIFIN